jgi:hypothetical protein
MKNIPKKKKKFTFQLNNKNKKYLLEISGHTFLSKEAIDVGDSEISRSSNRCLIITKRV